MPWLQRQLEALDKCIEHWEQNLKAAREYKIDDIDISATACALCHLNRTINTDCPSCIIFDFTKHSGCRNTPYEDVEECLEALDFDNEEDIDVKWLDLQCAIQDQVNFLKELKEKYTCE